MLKPPKLYTPRNFFSILTHYGATAGIVAGAFSLAQPWMLVTGALLAAALGAIAIKGSKALLEGDLEEHKPNHPHSPHLGDMVRLLYQRSGLGTQAQPVYSFRLKPSEERNPQEKERGEKDKHLLKDLLREAFNKMANVPNAAASNLGKPIIMISEPLLELLNDDEEFAVLAHEFAHATARHQHLSLPQKLLTLSSQLSTFLALLATGLSTGILTFLGAGLVGNGVQKACRRFHPNKDLWAKDEETLSLSDLTTKKEADARRKFLSSTAVATVFTAANPYYASLFAAAAGLSFTGTVFEKSFSRSCEYQADRGAVQLGAHATDLITALRKIHLLMDRSKQNAWGEEPVSKPGTLTRLWNRINATHPTLENRIKRLESLARQAGAHEADILKAVKGPLDISHAPDVPYDTIKMLASRFYSDDGTGHPVEKRLLASSNPP